MTNKIACSFLHNLVEESPFKIYTILTDNGAQFTYALLAEHLRAKGKIHPFDQACQSHNIQHRLTKFRHPWTNGQVEIFNRKIKENTTKKYQYDTIDRLKKHLMAFVLAYNHQKPLRALKYKCSYDILIEAYIKTPQLFRENPNHKIMELNNY